MARYATANDIINRAAVEVGLSTVTDPVSSIDDAFVQLVTLLDSCGQELIELNQWQQFVKQYEIITQAGDTGEYDLPDDFAYMIDQTGWDRSNDLPVAGPLSAQDWTYLEGRDLVSSTIYASFRELDGKMNLFPQPPPVGLRVTFEYMGRNWLREQGAVDAFRDTVGSGDNIVLFEPILMVKFLKLKFLSAKGFDATTAALEFDNIFQGRIGKNTGAPILSASNTGGYPYLNSYRNLPDTHYGR